MYNHTTVTSSKFERKRKINVETAAILSSHKLLRVLLLININKGSNQIIESFRHHGDDNIFSYLMIFFFVFQTWSLLEIACGD